MGILQGDGILGALYEGSKNKKQSKALLKNKIIKAKLNDAGWEDDELDKMDVDTLGQAIKMSSDIEDFASESKREGKDIEETIETSELKKKKGLLFDEPPIKKFKKVKDRISDTLSGTESDTTQTSEASSLLEEALKDPKTLDENIKTSNSLEDVVSKIKGGVGKESVGKEDELSYIESPLQLEEETDMQEKEMGEKLSGKGIPYISESGDLKYTKSGIQQEGEEDASRQQTAITILNSAIGEDAKSILAADKGLYTMFGQVFSLSSYMNAREEEIKEAGLTGNNKVKAVKAWFNSLPWIEKEGFERTGAIPGATGFTILRTVPNITGSKQGLSAMAKMIEPSFPKGYTEKGYSNQMLIQAVDDSFRFRAAINKNKMFDELGYEKDTLGRWILPENVSIEEGEYIRNEMEKIQLTDTENKLLNVMKQLILDAPPAKKYSSKYDLKTGKQLSKTKQRIIQLKEEIAIMRGGVTNA